MESVNRLAKNAGLLNFAFKAAKKFNPFKSKISKTPKTFAGRFADESISAAPMTIGLAAITPSAPAASSKINTARNHFTNNGAV